MTLFVEANWFALFNKDFSGGGYGITYVPVIAWKEGCVEGYDSLIGFVVEDREGNDLPFPVPAQNVFGFVKYVKLTNDEVIAFAIEQHLGGE